MTTTSELEARATRRIAYYLSLGHEFEDDAELVAALLDEVTRLTAERDAENRVGRNCTKLLCAAESELARLRHALPEKE